MAPDPVANGTSPSDEPSEEQRFWDDRADTWDSRAEEIHSFADAFGGPARDRLALQPGDRVIDIGCGPGVTTIDLARYVGSDGEVVGVDISTSMLAAATRRAARAAVPNVRFVHSDVEHGSLGSGFDAAYSRFGVMFFPNPHAAFAAVAAALRPGGRIACAVWAPMGDNPWMFLPTIAAASILGADLTPPGPDEPGPFSLSEPDRILTVLTAAGFADVQVEPVTGAQEVTEARAQEQVETFLGAGPLGGAFADASDHDRRAAVEAVLAAFEPYRQGDRWQVPAKALIVHGHRPG